MTDNMAGLLALLMDIFVPHCLMEIAFLDDPREQLERCVTFHERTKVLLTFHGNKFQYPYRYNNYQKKT